MITATIAKILTFSCVDGPGNRMVIFLQGCNYRCINCHNPQTIDNCDHCGDCVPSCPTQSLQMVQHGTKKVVQWQEETCTHCDLCIEVCPKQSSPKTKKLSVSQLLTLIHDNKFFINGITISGGEATLQIAFITALFRAIKQDPELSHLSCMIDSNGSLSTTGWQQVLPYLDGAMIDLKAWQDDTHRWLTNRSNHRVFETINLLHQHQKLYELRLLHIPGVTDFETEIEALVNYLKPFQDTARIKLNAFQHHGVTGEALSWPVCKKEEIEDLAQSLTQRGMKNVIIPTVFI